MPEFRFKAGTFDKFWRLSVAGNAVEVHLGRSNTTGQVLVLPFGVSSGK